MRPVPDDYPPYMENYIRLVSENSVLEALMSSAKSAKRIFQTIPTEKANMAYAEGKWSIKELIVHLIDTERIFAYRALAFARGETQKLPAFDENLYAVNSDAATRELKDIIEEFDGLRQSTFMLFRSFSNDKLAIKGEIPAGICSVNAFGFAICGHTLHHLQILEERYLK